MRIVFCFINEICHRADRAKSEHDSGRASVGDRIWPSGDDITAMSSAGIEYPFPHANYYRVVDHITPWLAMRSPWTGFNPVKGTIDELTLRRPAIAECKRCDLLKCFFSHKMVCGPQYSPTNSVEDPYLKARRKGDVLESYSVPKLSGADHP